MSDLVGLAVIGAIVLLAVLFLYYLSRPYNVSSEEFEKRAREGPGLINAAMIGLQKFLDPAAEKAIEVQQDLRAGHYNKEDDTGDPPDTDERK
jgi:hypothetical protein